MNTYAQVIDCFTPEEWETDPFGCASHIARMAARFALSFDDAMNETEATNLSAIIDYCG
jgi:hypothetical protein